MGEEEEITEEICRLIRTNWDLLTKAQRESVEMSNKSMDYFIELYDFDRVSYEQKQMLKVLNNTEKWI